jgi:cyclic-di-AMP phosphodiesterase PgpH
VIEPGERLTAADVEALEQLGLRQSGVDPARVAAAALFAVLGGVLTGGYVRAARPAALRGPRRLALFALLLLVPAVAAKFALPLIVPDLDRHFLAYAIPLAAAPMAAAVLLDVAAAVLLATVLAAIVAFISTYLPAAGPPGVAGQLETARLALTVLAGSLVGVYVTARADRLQRYLAAGIAVGATVAGVLFTLWLVDLDRRAMDLPWIAGAAAVNGLLTALIAVGSFVLLSRPFGIITRLELMELAQLSHPLLRRLQDEAPGSFQHSMLVGNMAERAADRIGADALLVRVGAYYHDVGKLVAPGFFVENVPEGEDSPHEGLDPLQSTRVILQHVTGGIEIARREGLPEAVVRFIPEHHGTRLMTFFYRRAAEEDSEVSPELFRYAGPKPQTRETALVMIADSSEATVRASADRSGQRIREIIEGIIRERIDEGQFDECDLSLRDLRVAAETYAGALAAAYHPRVEYPQPTERELAQRRMPALPAADGDAARGSEREEPAREPSDGRPASRPARRDEEIEPPSRRPAVPASPRPDQPELHEDTT